jgi:hypothetical protein
MATSILTSVKKNLGIVEDYTVFDPDILMHINTVFTTLTQLGIGPPEGYMIEDKTETWEDYLAADMLKYNAVKTYVYLRVRILFDPPTSSYHVQALKDELRELEWRINVRREEDEWVDPSPVPPLLENI